VWTGLQAQGDDVAQVWYCKQCTKQRKYKDELVTNIRKGRPHKGFEHQSKIENKKTKTVMETKVCN
jgi:hypothetical protein